MIPSDRATQIRCGGCNAVITVTPAMLDGGYACEQCGWDIDYSLYEPLVRQIAEREEARKAAKAAERAEREHIREVERARRRLEKQNIKENRKREKELSQVGVAAQSAIAVTVDYAPLPDKRLNGKAVICSNPNCGYRGPTIRKANGSFLLFLFLLLFAVLPAIIYFFLTSGYSYLCPKCGMKLPID